MNSYIGAGGGSRTPTGLPLLDFESDESATYQHLSQSIAQNQRPFLSRVALLCPVCAIGLGTILGTADDSCRESPIVLEGEL